MNIHLLFFLLNLILLSRLALTFRDGGASRSDIIKMTLIPLAALLFVRFSAGWIVLLLWLSARPFLMSWVERNGPIGRLNRNRFLTLILHVVVIGVLCSPLFALEFNGVPDAIGRGVRNLLTEGMEGMKGLEGLEPAPSRLLNAQVLIFGFLLVINEMNTLLRWLLAVFQLDTFADQDPDSRAKEYNTGRVIGLLERIFVLAFVLMNQFSAIGFILAAKGVTRFQDFRDRLFAEYVLIGTLLSTLLAMLTALFVKWVWSLQLA